MLKLSSERLAIGLLFVVIAALACFAPAQSDTWWLLRAGQEIWRTQAVLLRDTFSYTATGNYWPNHEWLTEVLFYAAYSAGGMALVTAFCATLIVAAWALSWRLARGLFEVRFIVFAASLSACVTEWALRPQVTTLFLFSLTCVLLVRRRLAWLPPVFVVWANLHGGVSLGLVAIVGAAASSTVSDRRVPWRAAAAGLASAAATCLSPLGIGLWTFIPASVERLRANQVSEWLPPGLEPTFYVFWMLAAALAVLAIARWRRADAGTRTLAGIGVAMLPFAVTSARHVPVFLLAAVPAVVSLLHPEAAPAHRARNERETVNGWVFTGAAALAIALVSIAWRLQAPSLGWHPISEDAARAIERCRGPIYNTFNEGGVLAWFTPDVKVFIDNRQDPYPVSFLRASHQLELDGAYRPLFATYDVHCAAVPPGSVLAERLERDPDWGTVHRDDGWAIFTRR